MMKSRALRNVITHLALLVRSISVTMITFQGHSKVKQLRKFKVAYFGKCLPIQSKWQYPLLTPSVPHAQTLHRHRNDTDWIYMKLFHYVRIVHFWTLFRLNLHTHVTVHEKTKYESKIAILDNAHLKVQTLCYFLLKSDCQMEIKLHLFEIMLFCFLHAILLFYYSSVLLKPNFLKKWKNTWFSHAQTHLCTDN